MSEPSYLVSCCLGKADATEASDLPTSLLATHSLLTVLIIMLFQFKLEKYISGLQGVSRYGIGLFNISERALSI